MRPVGALLAPACLRCGGGWPGPCGVLQHTLHLCPALPFLALPWPGTPSYPRHPRSPTHTPAPLTPATCPTHAATLLAGHPQWRTDPPFSGDLAATMAPVAFTSILLTCLAALLALYCAVALGKQAGLAPARLGLALDAPDEAEEVRQAGLSAAPALLLLLPHLLLVWLHVKCRVRLLDAVNGLG